MKVAVSIFREDTLWLIGHEDFATAFGVAPEDVRLIEWSEIEEKARAGAKFVSPRNTSQGGVRIWIHSTEDALIRYRRWLESISQNRPSRPPLWLWLTSANLLRDAIPMDMKPLFDVVKLMAGFKRPWFVAGGWGVDAWLGRKTRDHKDIEIAIWRGDQDALRSHFNDWVWHKCVAGEEVLWEKGETLELPVHELHAHHPDRKSVRLEILLNENDGQNWIFRRDATTSLPIGEFGEIRWYGIPVLNPAVILLYKATLPSGPSDKDDHDFALHSLLSETECRWLSAAIARKNPTHRWLEPLEARFNKLQDSKPKGLKSTKGAFGAMSYWIKNLFE